MSGKKMWKRIVSIFLMLTLLAGALPTGAISGSVQAKEVDLSVKGNEFLKVYVDKNSGGFAVLPAEWSFEQDMLKSYASVRVDGKEYVYGENYPMANTSVTEDVSKENEHVIQWTLFDYAIQQHISIVEDANNTNAWAAHIYYDVIYLGEKSSEVELSLLLDTNFGVNDNIPVIVDGEGIMSEKEYAKAPNYFFTTEDTFGAKAYADLTRADEMLTVPSALSFANYSNVKKGSMFEFAANEDSPLEPDSAALFTFPKKSFSAEEKTSETRREMYSVIYGFFDLKSNDSLVSTLANPVTKYEIIELDPHLNVFTYKIGESEAEGDKLYAAEGEQVVITRHNVPGVVFDNEAGITPDELGGTLDIVQGYDGDGNRTYTFTMIDSAVRVSQNYSASDGWYKIEVLEPPTVYENDNTSYTMSSKLSVPNGVVQAGEKFTFSAHTASTKNVFLSAVQTYSEDGIAEATRKDLSFKQVTSENIWEEFSPTFEITMPTAIFGGGTVEIRFAVDALIVDWDVVGDLTFIDPKNHGDDTWIEFTTAGYDEKEFAASESIVIGKPAGEEFVNTINPNDDLGKHKLGIYDSYGNEVPFLYRHHLSSTEGYNGKTFLYDPEAVIQDGDVREKNGSDPPGIHFDYVTNKRPTIELMYENRFLDQPAKIRFEVWSPEVFKGNKLTNVTVKTFEPDQEPPTTYAVTVEGRVDLSAEPIPMPEGTCAVSATKAAQGSIVILSLYGTEEYIIEEVNFTGGSPATTEIEKNRLYEITMPANDIYVQVKLKEVVVPKHRVIQQFTYSQNHKQTFDYTVEDKDGNFVSTIEAGEKVYISEPLFKVGTDDEESEWTVPDIPYEVEELYGDENTAKISVTPESGNRFSFVMPDGDVKVKLMASAAYKYFNISVAESIDPDYANLAKGIELDTRGLYYIYNNKNYNEDGKARLNETITVAIPKNRDVVVHSENSDTPRPSPSYFSNAYLQVTDSTGRVFVAAEKAENEIFQSEQFKEYSFTMPEGDVNVEVIWKWTSVPNVTISTNLIPDHIPEPTVVVEPLLKGATEGSHKFLISIHYEDSNYDLTFADDKGNIIPDSELRLPVTTKNSQQKIGKAYEFETSIDKVFNIVCTEHPKLPVADSIVQSSKYVSFNPWLILTGKGLNSHDFEYRITKIFENGTVESYERDGSPFAGGNPNASPEDTTTVSFNLNMHNEPEKYKSLKSVTFEVRYLDKGMYDWGERKWNKLASISMEWSEQIETSNGMYQFVSVVNDKNSYKAWGADSSSQLDKVMNEVYGKKLPELISFSSGNGFEYDESTSTYTLNNVETDATVAIGNILSAQIPKGEKMTIVTENSGVFAKIPHSATIAMRKGNVYIPDTNADLSGFMDLNIVNNQNYAIKYDDYYDDDKNTTKPGVVKISMSWPKEVTDSWSKLNGALSSNVNQVSIFSDSVVLGGDISLSVPLLGEDLGFIKAETEQIKYGTRYDPYTNESRGFDYLGVVVEGEAGIPNILGLLDGSKSKSDVGLPMAQAYIDTIGKQEYRFKVDIDLFKVGVNGELSLISWEKNRDVLLPDTFILGMKVPITIIPGVLKLTNAGGGFSNLARTINGDYHLVPPFKLHGEAGFQLVEIFNGNVGFTLGPSEISATAEAGVKFMGLDLQILESLSYWMKMDGHDDLRVNGQGDVVHIDKGDGSVLQWEMGGAVRATFIPKADFLSGAAGLSYGFYKDLKNSKVSHYFEIYGRVRFQIPKKWVLGLNPDPIVLLGIDMMVNERFARASARVLGVKCTYTYSFVKKKHDFDVFSTAETALTAVTPIYNDMGEKAGEVAIGGNLRLAGTSTSVLQDPGMMGTLANTAPVISVNGTTHTVNVPDDFINDGGNTLVQIGLSAEEVNIVDPDGNPYPLSFMPNEITASDSTSDAYNAIRSDTALLVSLKKAGAWKIIGSKAFSSYLLEAAPIPEMTETALDEGQSKITFEAKNLDSSKTYYVSYGFARMVDGTEQRRELGCEKYTSVTSISGDMSYDENVLKARLETGEYYAYAELFTDIDGYDYTGVAEKDMSHREFLGMMRDKADNTLSIRNADDPQPVSTINLQSAPDGKLDVEFERPQVAEEDGVDYQYEIKLYEYLNATDAPLPVMTAEESPKTEVVGEDGEREVTDETVTTQTQLKFVVAHEYNSQNTQKTVLSGLVPDKDYTVDITVVKNITTEYKGEDEYGEETDEVFTASRRSEVVNTANHAKVVEPVYPNFIIEGAVDSGNGFELTFGEIGGVISVVSRNSNDKYNYELIKREITENNDLLEATDTVVETSNGSSAMGYTIPDADSNIIQYIVRAENTATGDALEIPVAINRASLPPVLAIEHLSEGVVKSSGQRFTIKGQTEPGAGVTVMPVINNQTENEEPDLSKVVSTVAKEDGSFSVDGYISPSEKNAVTFTVASSGVGGVSYENIDVEYKAAPQGSNYTTEIYGYTVITSNYAKPEIDETTGLATLPNGGIITTPDGTRISVPKETTIDPTGKVTIGSPTALITLDTPDGETSKLTVGKGTAINKNGDITVSGSGGKIVLPSGLTLEIKSGSVLSVDEESPNGYTVKGQNRFKDVKAGQWFYDDVEFAAAHGIFFGVTPDKFEPSLGMTRAMLVTVLGRLAGVEEAEPTEQVFSDVKLGEYYSKYVAWAAREGIVKGVTSDKFAPGRQITRQDLVTILDRYVKWASMNLPNKTDYAIFEDEVKIADYAKEAVRTFYEAEIVKGKSKTIFAPSKNATRAEVAAIFKRLILAAKAN